MSHAIQCRNAVPHSNFQDLLLYSLECELLKQTSDFRHVSPPNAVISKQEGQGLNQNSYFSQEGLKLS